MNEPTITCPKCGTEIKLTESLAAPLLASTRVQFEKQLAQKDSDIAVRESAMREKERALLQIQRDLDDQVAGKVAAQLKTERVRVAAEEAKKANAAAASEIDAKARELTELHEVLKVRDAKLAEAQRAQAELIKKQRELDDARRELELPRCNRRSRNSSKRPSRAHSSCKAKCRNWSWKTCCARSFHST